MISTLAFVATLLGTQQINCFPRDPNSPDRMVMSLALSNDSTKLPIQGTLFLSSGIDREGEQNTSEVMPLVLLSPTEEEIKSHSVSYQARNNPSNFIVSMNEGDIGKSLSSFSLNLILERVSDGYRVTQEMSCYATVFSQ